MSKGLEIRLGLGSCCVASGSQEVYDALRRDIAAMGANVTVRQAGCIGMCHRVPLLEFIEPTGRRTLYGNVKASAVPAILQRHVTPRNPLYYLRRGWRKLTRDDAWVTAGQYLIDPQLGPPAEFLDPQVRIATAHCGRMDPTDIGEYRAFGGYQALRRAVTEMSPQQVIDEVTAGGLRGRGGAGFPTGRKWSAVRAQPGDKKYVICNGDEGDPGAFMDRMLLEAYPHRIVEGVALAAYAVGADEAIFYIRQEYPLAVARVREAIRQAVEAGLIGEGECRTAGGPPSVVECGTAASAVDRPALGPISPGEAGRITAEGGCATSTKGPLLPLRIHIRQGSGAFVCGEETALIASIEGRRGMPRLRPPYPAQSGLYGCPTCVNNVETLALVPAIIRDGPDSPPIPPGDSPQITQKGSPQITQISQIELNSNNSPNSSDFPNLRNLCNLRGNSVKFAAIGTPSSRGTKVFSLTGKINRGGLIEVPMGTTIRTIVELIGGGIKDGRRFTAVQIGGPSGGCIPAALADTPIDYEALANLGAIMGSGGLVVLDDTDCMVDIARYFLQFTENESCGKCTFCRVGTKRMLEILNRIVNGLGKRADLDELETLANQVKTTSLCGLGQTAPNPVLTTLRYFRADYEAHLAGRCPAGRCTTLIEYKVTDDCIGCTICAQVCPVDAIERRPHQRHYIDMGKCTRCHMCVLACPAKAIRVE